MPEKPLVYSFAPLAGRDAKTLILGSMPGRESLRRQQYYAHARNAFWPILTRLLELDAPCYADRARQLTGRGFAVWDVLKACFRRSSLDSDIDNSTLVPNDFEAFFRRQQGIKRVFFNGAKAESVYLRHVLPELPDEFSQLKLQRLPSTSPAHAAMTLEEKLEAWSVLVR